MAPIESLSVTVSRRDTPGVTVRLRGEHDLSTVPALSAALTQAITLDDADVVVDLTEVQFMGAATVGVLRRARELLKARSRSLMLRSPPRRVRRLLELCGDEDLLTPAEATPATWAPVPAASRAKLRVTTAPTVRLPAALVPAVAGQQGGELRTAVAGTGAP